MSNLGAVARVALLAEEGNLPQIVAMHLRRLGVEPTAQLPSSRYQLGSLSVGFVISWVFFETIDGDFRGRTVVENYMLILQKMCHD